jgi:hypothetical protein
MLLFAIVLGLAAMAAAVSRPRARDTASPPQPATNPAKRKGPPTAQVRYDLTQRARTQVVPAGRRIVVTVAVNRPGQVELEGLGLSAPAEPLTPAHFDVLAPKPERYPLRYTPAGENSSRSAGVLRVLRSRSPARSSGSGR